MLSEVRLEILHLELFKQPALDGLFSTRFSIAIEYDNTIVRTSLYPLLHNGIDFVKTGCFVIPYDLDCMSERAVKIEITGFEEKETYQAVLQKQLFLRVQESSIQTTSRKKQVLFLPVLDKMETIIGQIKIRVQTKSNSDSSQTKQHINELTLSKRTQKQGFYQRIIVEDQASSQVIISREIKLTVDEEMSQQVPYFGTRSLRMKESSRSAKISHCIPQEEMDRTMKSLFGKIDRIYEEINDRTCAGDMDGSCSSESSDHYGMGLPNTCIEQYQAYPSLKAASNLLTYSL